ncbi:MAG: hypothetical protein ABI119_05880 [Gemmatimonadaceae bacterium]
MSTAPPSPPAISDAHLQEARDFVATATRGITAGHIRNSPSLAHLCRLLDDHDHTALAALALMAEVTPP